MFYSLSPRLFAFSLKFVKDEFAAEEIVEDSMLLLWEKREKFSHVQDIKSYLYFVVRNASLAHLKKQNKVIPLDMAVHDAQSNYDEHVIEEEVHAVLIQALDSLPEKCRKVFELSCLEGLKYKDIAEDMQISVNTVKSQRARAIDLLKNNLKDHPMIIFLICLF